MQAITLDESVSAKADSESTQSS